MRTRDQVDRLIKEKGSRCAICGSDGLSVPDQVWTMAKAPPAGARMERGDGLAKFYLVICTDCGGTSLVSVN